MLLDTLILPLLPLATALARPDSGSTSPTEEVVLRGGIDTGRLEDPWALAWIDDPLDLDHVHDASLSMPEDAWLFACASVRAADWMRQVLTAPIHLDPRELGRARAWASELEDRVAVVLGSDASRTPFDDGHLEWALVVWSPDPEATRELGRLVRRMIVVPAGGDLVIVSNAPALAREMLASRERRRSSVPVPRGVSTDCSAFLHLDPRWAARALEAAAASGVRAACLNAHDLRPERRRAEEDWFAVERPGRDRRHLTADESRRLDAAVDEALKKRSAQIVEGCLVRVRCALTILSLPLRACPPLHIGVRGDLGRFGLRAWSVARSR
ncbi:MAG: hypothetical protein AAGB93_24505 [Planctomycetota bacterium]